jgi:hypothetical protein
MILVIRAYLVVYQVYFKELWWQVLPTTTTP